MAKSINPFRHFDSLTEVIGIVVMMYVRYSLSLRKVEDLLHEWGIDICHKAVRLSWNRFGTMFAAGLRRKVQTMRLHHEGGCWSPLPCLAQTNFRWAGSSPKTSCPQPTAIPMSLAKVTGLAYSLTCETLPSRTVNLNTYLLR